MQNPDHTSIVKKSHLILFIIMLFSTCVLFPGLQEIKAEDFFINDETKQREITVVRGTPFNVYFDGKGWYLNRYDRHSLSFKSRTVEPEYTSFLIYPIKVGSSFLLFSFLEQDVRLTVRIVEQTEEKTVETSKGFPELEKPLSEGLEGEPDVSLLTEEKDESSRAGTAPVDGEMYYVDKENRIVMIPSKDENEPYNRGVRLYNEGSYGEAREPLLNYTKSCEVCSYKTDALFKLADIAAQFNKNDEAIGYLDAVIQMNNRVFVVEAYIKKAEIYYSAGRVDDAADAYRNAYNLGDHDTGILEKMGDIYYLKEDYEGALKVYEEGIAQGLDNDEVIFRVASFYDKSGVLRNIERAYHYYKIIVDGYRTSEHYAYAEERVRFFEKNFFNYR